MANKSIVTINQTLHGYRNGHQLLANSCDLTSEVKRQLLFQSDLSGSLKLDSFNEYLTGYPLKDIGWYAFAKTWYAYEMPRPGCVWTQTLLIEFSDIGKFNDFSFLTSLFKRPDEDYSFYSLPVEIDLKNSFTNASNFDVDKKLYALERLYNFPNQPVLIPSENPKNWENTVLSLWSDQWPRLRRNFTFCTGALDKKEIYGSEFDLQIVPISNFSQLNFSNQIHSIPNVGIIKSDNWNSVLKKIANQKLRKFLWLVGSDIPGNRENYFILLKIFNSLESYSFNILSLIDILKVHYPSPSTAKTLKKLLFSNDGLLSNKLSELEVIKVIASPILQSLLDINSLDINKRLIDITLNQNLSIEILYSLWKSFPIGTISDDIWNTVSYEAISEFHQIIIEDEELLNIFLNKNTNFLGSKFVWQSSIDFQRIILRKISSSNSFNWKNIINDILEIHSLIILDLYQLIGNDIVLFSLDWLNNRTGEEYFTYEWQIIIKRNTSIVKKWLYNYRKSINIIMYEFLYVIYTHYDLVNFNLPIDFWRRAARISVGNKNLLIAISTLSVGFSRKSDGGEWIVTESFQFVYNSARSGNIHFNQWNIITLEEYSEDETNWLTDIISLFGLEKKMKNVYEWDYCELLIRTLVNLYLKYPLDKQAFVMTFDDEYTFSRAINYCISLRKGIKFLSKLYRQQKISSFVIHPFQRKILDNLKEIF